MAEHRPVLIVNPRSGGGLGEARWARLASRIAAALGPCDTRFTDAVGDGRRIAGEEVAGGRRLLVAVGGDGTVSEVADGILATRDGEGRAADAPEVELGIIPCGTGGDFRRTLELPSDAGEAARKLRDSQGRALDAGRVSFLDHDGRPVVRHFMNVSSFGFSSAVATRANASSKRLGGRIAYLAATVRSLVSYQNMEVWISADGAPRQRWTALMAAVGNGCFFGGGMKICPTAKLDDGLLDLVVVGDLKRLEVLAKVGRLYDGSHLSLDQVHHAPVRRLEAHPVDPEAKIPVELDGETPGRLPLSIEVMPGALRVRC